MGGSHREDGGQGSRRHLVPSQMCVRSGSCSEAALSPRKCYAAFSVRRGAGPPPDPWELPGGDQSTAGQEQREHPTTNNCSSLKSQVTVKLETSAGVGLLKCVLGGGQRVTEPVQLHLKPVLVLKSLKTPKFFWSVFNFSAPGSHLVRL